MDHTQRANFRLGFNPSEVNCLMRKGESGVQQQTRLDLANLS
jgi:hypothetical protein